MMNKILATILTAIALVSGTGWSYAEQPTVRARIYTPNGELYTEDVYPLNTDFVSRAGDMIGEAFAGAIQSGLSLQDMTEYAVSGLYFDILGAISSVERECERERIVFHPETETFSVTPAVYGYRVDRDSIGRDIASGLKTRDIVIHLRGHVLTTGESLDVERITALIGEFTTDYSRSGWARRHNIALAAESLDGVRVDSGESLSFNETVGKRTEERGYRMARVIFDGEFVEGIGGGVCQVSTTLYNAVVRSGLSVETYAPHSMTVGYVEPSLDAMVSEYQDFVFSNTTGYPVYISAKTLSDKLRVRIYGELNPCGENVSLVSRVERVIPSPDGRQDGCESVGIRVVKVGNRTISERIIRRDKYRPGGTA